MSDGMFTGLDKSFKRLRDISIWDDGFYGSITKNTFRGLDYIQRIRIKDTDITNIDDDSFSSFKDIEGSFYHIKSR